VNVRILLLVTIMKLDARLFEVIQVTTTKDNVVATSGIGLPEH